MQSLEQSNFEERLNALTHGIAALLGISGLVLLIIYNQEKTDWSLFSVVVYGISIIVLFTASTIYHAVNGKKLKNFFRIIDHISIYLLIAGTYTPVTLIALEQSFGWPLFWIVWIIAAFGTVLKIFFTGRFEVFSVILYLAMGWLAVFDFSYLSKTLGSNGILLLVAGGLAYTIGIIFYAIEKIPYNHVIWHVFVFFGALFHFFMIFCFVI